MRFLLIMNEVNIKYCCRIDGGIICCVGYKWDYESEECVCK